MCKKILLRPRHRKSDFGNNAFGYITRLNVRATYYIRMIADFHNDILTKEDSPDLCAISKEVKSCVCAIYTGSRRWETVRGLAEKFRRKRKKNLFLALEDASYLNERNAEEVCAWKPVSVSLTWNGSNKLAGGCQSDGGLTARGKAVAKLLAANGISLDCAHLNRRSFYDLLDTVGRVVDTHTCFSGVHSHPRNLDDAQIREIVARKGLIGIAFVGKFLAEGKAGIKDVFRHTDYAVQKFGDDFFCFGTDFNGTDDLPEGVKSYGDCTALYEMFLKAGYPRSSADKIFAENLQNFLTKKS